MSEPEPNSVAIVGAGAAGLAAALTCLDLDLEPVVFESDDRVGGAIATIEKDGFIVDLGPNTLVARDATLPQLIERLDLGDAVITPGDDAMRRYVVRDGRPVAIPTNPLRFLGTPLFSAGAKLRLLREPFVRSKSTETETVADFVRRRLGDEVLDYAVDPFTGGVFAGDPERLLVGQAFPRLVELEREHGSLIRGLVKSGSRRFGPARPSSIPFSFVRGMDALPRAMATAIGERIRFRSEVVGYLFGDNDVTLEIETDASRSTERFTGVIVTVPLHRLHGLGIPGLDLEAVSAVPHPPVAVVCVGFDRETIDHPLDGFGVLVPSREPFRILGALFSSSLFPNRAPAGSVLLTCFVGGRRHAQDAELGDDAVVELVTRDLRALVGARGSPSFTHVHRWPQAIPQYEESRSSAIDALCELERGPSPIAFAGNAIAGISVGETIASGQAAADRLAERLARR